MSDGLREAIRRAADGHEPPENWLYRIHERARKKRRNRRVAAGVVGLGLSVVLVVALAAQYGHEKATSPAGLGHLLRAGVGSGSR